MSDIPSVPSVPAVIDSLTSSSTTDALSANQGRLLNEKIGSFGGVQKIRAYDKTFSNVVYSTSTTERFNISSMNNDSRIPLAFSIASTGSATLTPNNSYGGSCMIYIEINTGYSSGLQVHIRSNDYVYVSTPIALSASYLDKINTMAHSSVSSLNEPDYIFINPSSATLTVFDWHITIDYYVLTLN